MADTTKRARSASRSAFALWLALGAVLAAQGTWAGASDGRRTPQGGAWDQPLSASNQSAYLCQEFDPVPSAGDTYIADDFTNTVPWLITSIYVPGITWATGCHLSCARTLSWAISTDAGGVPSFDPGPSGPNPFWGLMVPPSDSQVALSTGTSGWLSDVTLNLDDPVFLPPGTWWLIFFPTLDETACGCRYGRQPSDTTNGYAAQVANPGGGAGLPATWTSVQAASTWLLQQQDFAFRLEVSAPTVVGDRVWYDTNQNGIQDAGEPGQAGILTALFDNGTCEGVPLRGGASLADGTYMHPFPGPGTYCVAFRVPPGWYVSPADQGTDDTRDSDAYWDAVRDQGQIRSLSLAGDDLTQDIGLYTRGDIGGRVWCDENRNQTYEAGEGRSSVQVWLLPDPDCDTVASDHSTYQDTGANGAFLFTGNMVGPSGNPQCYVVRANTNDLGDCDSPYTIPERYPSLDADQPDVLDLEIDFYRGHSLGGNVWYDQNQDGIADPQEMRLTGWNVTLYDNGECTGSSAGSTVTSLPGYSFDHLQPGTYCLRFTVPPGWQITAHNQGADDTVDSDASPDSGRVRNINLTADRLYESMGVYRYGSIGGHVFCDGNGNDRYDAGEGLKEALVSQREDLDCDGFGDGQQSDALTDDDGFYQFGQRVVGPPGEPICFVVSVDQSTLGACDTPIMPTGWRVDLDADLPEHLDVDFGFRRGVVLDERLYAPLILR